ncbi:cupin domain-containing protein [Lysobacter sp. TLK-CK17T]|uniref:Cupin domain-containing protein n=2 Tax=Marilutibacter chinensis TaxID=2912247 RepID=A0ABS9HNN9_9GAMM|nr:cupin domain-containing protein [Lysobacter chinensis]MCF7220238.1 cupin domain-containing protein [Lysobacter chinensis]
MAPVDFLRDYWQKRPLLIRNAFPDFVSPIQPEDLAGLACEELALSRIVSHDRAGDRWQLRSGPFREDEFPGMPHQDWTLLVQDVDKWDADVASLLDHFDFLPRWRIDDIMVSFAAPGGSVGAHVDQYDVFLLQAQGHRRWQIDASAALGRGEPPLDFRNDTELKLLREFSPTHDWVLGPGDMLYLPPGVPHHGVAEDACLTFSVGMRAPSAAELLGDFVDTLAADADESQRYRDPDLAPPADPAEIDTAAMNRAVEALNMLRMNDPERLGDWFGRFITLYRSAGEVMAGGPEYSRIEVEWDLEQGAVLDRHPWSRMAWRRARRGARLYVNGQAHALSSRDAARIANQRSLDGQDYRALSQAGRDCVFELFRAGHYQLRVDDEDGGNGASYLPSDGPSGDGPAGGSAT